LNGDTSRTRRNFKFPMFSVVLVAVMQVGRVRVAVRTRGVPMWMAVFAGDRGFMRMIMMAVVMAVSMLVLERFMPMPVLVPFCEM